MAYQVERKSVTSAATVLGKAFYHNLTEGTWFLLKTVSFASDQDRNPQPTYIFCTNLGTMYAGFSAHGFLTFHWTCPEMP